MTPVFSYFKELEMKTDLMGNNRIRTSAYNNKSTQR